MSRSYKHNNFAANSCMGYDGSEKKDKQRANRKLRSKSKIIINITKEADDIILPHIKEVDEKFTWIKEGKTLLNPKKDYSNMYFTKDGKLKR